jgi:SNF2 family DNA or RNA helicase
MKKDVMKELPPKTRITLNVDVNLKEYQAIQQLFWDEGGEGDACLHELRKALTEAKIPAIIEWIEEFKLTGKKLIVFAHHRVIIKALIAHFPEALAIWGDTKGDTERQSINRAFRDDPEAWLLIGGITACSEGLNFVSASDVLMAEMIYNPKKMEQAEDRAYRKGQTLPVTIFYMLARNSFEQALWGMVKRKRDMVDQVVDGKRVEKTKNIKAELIQSLFKNKNLSRKSV